MRGVYYFQILADFKTINKAGADITFGYKTNKNPQMFESVHYSQSFVDFY